MKKLIVFCGCAMFWCGLCDAMYNGTYFTSVVPVEGNGRVLRFFTQKQINGIVNKVDEEVLPNIFFGNAWNVINKFGFVSLPVSDTTLDLLYSLSEIPVGDPKLNNFFREHSLQHLQAFGYAIHALSCLQARGFMERLAVEIYQGSDMVSWIPGRTHKENGEEDWTKNKRLPMYGYVKMMLSKGKLTVQQQNHGVHNLTFCYQYN